MIRLIIDDPGFTLTINGKEFRSPANIDIPLIKVHDVVRYLKAHGVSKYKFISQPDITKKIEPVREEEFIDKKNEVVAETKIIEKIVTQDNTEINTKLDRLEKMITKLSEKEPTIIKVTENGQIQTKKKDDDTHLEFIPNVDTSDLQLKTTGSKIIKNKEEMPSNVNDLANLLKKKS